MTVLYGIPNCDTVKKARTWLETHGVAFAFADFKKQRPLPFLFFYFGGKLDIDV